MSQASPQHLAKEWSWNEVEKCWELMKNCQIDGDEGNDEVGEKCEGEKEIALQCNEGPSLQTSSQHLVRESRIDAVEEKGGNEMKSIESSMKRWTWNEVEKCWELMKKCPIDGDEGNDEVDEECDDDASEVEDLNEDDEYVGNNEKLLMYDQVEDDEDSENGVDQLIGLGNQSSIHSAEAHGTQRPDTQQQTLQQHQQINLDQFNDNPEQFNPNSTQSTLSNQTKSNPFPCQPFISSLDQFCASLNHSSYSLNQFNIKSKFIMKPINLYIISSTLPTQSNLEDMDGDDQHGVKQLNRLEHRENHEGADEHGDQLARNMPCGQAVVPDKSPTYLHAYKHVCDHCGIRFNNLYNLKRHIRTHTGERPFHCTWIECNKSFTQNANMLRHLKSHKEALRERAQLMIDYQKEDADEDHYYNDKKIRDGSDFTVMNRQMSNVGENDEVREGYDDDETDVEDMDGDVQHGDDQLNELEHLENIEGAAVQGDLLAQIIIMKSGHAEVPDKLPTYNVHVCDHCGLRFFDLYNLKRHIRTHTGERPYQCTWAHCGKEFTQNHHLKNHIRTHTEKKPFKCVWESCKKAFSKRSYMLSHLKMHTGEFSHVCPHCGKGCILPYHLKVHIRKHTGERPYECPHENCGMAFVLKFAMQRHFTKYHTQNEI